MNVGMQVSMIGNFGLAKLATFREKGFRSTILGTYVGTYLVVLHR